MQCGGVGQRLINARVHVSRDSRPGLQYDRSGKDIKTWQSRTFVIQKYTQGHGGAETL